MRVNDYLIRGLRRVYRTIFRPKFNNLTCEINREVANNVIYDALISPEATMIARYGTTELICVNNYLCVTNEVSFFSKAWNFIVDKTHTPWWFEDHFHYMNIYSGIFPANKETAIRFSERYLNDTPEIDILGSHQYYEKFMPLGAGIKLVHLEALYPFFVSNPWTRALKGKKVLVIHPFEETIKMQYNKRKELFDSEDILPDFELITLKAVQSVGGTTVSFESWFSALEYMEDQIRSIDFDIALIGCGAYGLPLAATIKRMGRSAVHLGGGLQLLFGIKGSRWDKSDYGVSYGIPELFQIPYCSLYKSSWIRPLPEDTIEKAQLVEGASYW